MHSTSAIRITTLRESSGKVEECAAYLRLGRQIDSTLKSATTVKVPIYIADGSLNEFGYFPSWQCTEKHPDSGYVFGGKVIPFFNEAKELCQSLHQNFPLFSIIGWDVCIDMDNKAKINGMYVKPI